MYMCVYASGHFGRIQTNNNNNNNNYEKNYYVARIKFIAFGGMQCAQRECRTKLKRRRSEIKLFQGFYYFAFQNYFTLLSMRLDFIFHCRCRCDVRLLYGFSSFNFVEIGFLVWRKHSVRAILRVKWHEISSRSVWSGILNEIGFQFGSIQTKLNASVFPFQRHFRWLCVVKRFVLCEAKKKIW